MPDNLRYVEDDASDDRIASECAAAPLLVKPVPVSVQFLVKPTAMKVRPIPQRVSEQFYNEAFQEKIPMHQTNEAAAMAHDWHRRWTHQDEQNHTMPDEDFYRQTNIPTCYDFDRQGAMNPSLGASDASPSSPVDDDRFKRSRGDASYLVSPAQNALLFKPEDRLSASSWSESQSSSLSSYMVPQVKRRFTGAVIEDQDGVLQQHLAAPVAIRPVAVRPVAFRITRPDLVPPHDIQHGGIPQDITTFGKHENISPISCSEISSDSESFMMTLANRQRDQVHVVEDEEETVCHAISKPMSPLSQNVQSMRDAVLHSLAVTQGDVDSEKFKIALDPLLKYFAQEEMDSTLHYTGDSSVDGMWLQLSKPNYFGSLGENDNGDPMYTLGRMSFDMFSPTNLVCSLQGSFNPVEIVNEEERKAMLETVPKSLREEVESGKTVLRTYHVVAAFTIEPSLASFPNAPNKDVHRPIKGIMTTFGYSLSDPNEPNRQSIWFTGGRIEPNNNPGDIAEWKRLFTLHPPKHTFGEKAKLLAVKLLMGATVPEGMAEDGSMEFTFTRPIGGHGTAYVDVVYLDETLRIVKGHRGTIFVFSRIPQN